MSLLETNLANGRVWSRIGDAYAVTKKPRGLDRASLPTIPFAPMDSIPQNGAYMPEFTLKSPDQIASGTYFERGDVLIGKITPSFQNGKQALITELETPFGYATTEVIPLHALSDNHDSRFLFFYLLHPDVRHYVARKMEGSTGRKRVPEPVLLDLPIPNFELNEQSEIADALEAIMYAVMAEAACEKSAQDLKRTAMHALFTRGLRGEAQKETEIGPMPESWRATHVAELATIKGGKRMPKGVSLVREDTGRPYIRVTDFSNHGVREQGLMYVPHGYEEVIRRYRISSRDVYISIAGSIGIVGQVPYGLDDANLTENSAKIVVKGQDIVARYIMYALASQICQEQIRRVTSKNAQPKLALTRIEKLLIPFPTMKEEQREIVTILDAINSKIDLHRRKRAVLNDLFKVLLHKLTTGEIRATDLDLMINQPTSPRTY